MNQLPLSELLIGYVIKSDGDTFQLQSCVMSHFLSLLSQDDPESANSEIFFDMKQTDVTNLFRLESTGRGTARIYPTTSLKGKYGNYSVTIVAQDGGVPPNVRESVHHICIQVGFNFFLQQLFSNDLFRISMIMHLNSFFLQSISQPEFQKMQQLALKLSRSKQLTLTLGQMVLSSIL